jgi:hypothetical protein
VGLSGCRFIAVVALLLLGAGCAGVDYRERSALVQTRYATLENFGDEPISAEQVDDLLEEVAEILNVTLTHAAPRVRIMVTSPSQITEVYRRVVTIAAHGGHPRALYIPGPSLVLIPYYERTILGHELAHYLTDHYLKDTPRRQWERVASMVEDALPITPRTVARRTPGPEAVAAWMMVAPFLAPAN